MPRFRVEPTPEEMREDMNVSQYVRTCTLTDQLAERAINTPDFLKLKGLQYVAVFVYGTLKKGGKNHALLQDMPYLGLAESTAPCYQMKTYEGSFPIMKKLGKEFARQCDYVIGEMYAVTPQRLLILDRLEQNGFLYERTECMFWLKDQVAPVKPSHGKIYRPCIKAWAYMGTGFSNFEELPDCGMTKVDNRKYLCFQERPTNVFEDIQKANEIENWVEMTPEQKEAYIRQANTHFVERNFNDRIPF